LLSTTTAAELDHGSAEATAGNTAPYDPTAPLAVVYTSGTSGRPKAAVLTRVNFRASATASARHLRGKLRGNLGGSLTAGADERWLACLPLFHVGGLSILTRCVLSGSAAILHERFEPERVSQSLDADAITHVSFTATMLARVVEARGGRAAPPTLRCVLLGGGPCPAALMRRAEALGFPLAPTYGLTETTSQVATRPPGADPTAGLRALPGTEVRIASSAGVALPADTDGVIQVRSATVMRGYLNAPEATARALRDGWLDTGDLGRLDERGELHVLDRRSDLIVSGGENIYPAEVESALVEHPAIAEAVVIGVPDAEYGQRPLAWLVLEPPHATPTTEELTGFCRERLAGYKVPVAFRFTREVPRTAAGKPLRRKLSAATPD